MSVTFSTLNLALNFQIKSDTLERVACVVASIVLPPCDETLTAEIEANSMSDLMDAIESMARLMDDPDRIAAIRIDETACVAELDIAPRPVDPRRLN